MDRERALPIVVALLGVLVIGLSAATLDSAVTAESGGGFGLGPRDADPGFSGDTPDAGISGGSDASSGSVLFEMPCYPVLNSLPVVGGILGVFAVGSVLLYRRVGVAGPVAFLGALGIPTLLIHALLTSCTAGLVNFRGGGAIPLLGGSNNSSLPAGGFSLPGAGSGTSPTAPSVLLLFVLGLALVGAVALLFRSSSGDDADASGPPPSAGDVAAVGRAAGAAADRIEDSTDVTNEVYRAWKEMTVHLDVSNPAASTPAEFAAAAVEAGMAREDVAELTDLFEEVRYGGADPTEDREARALDALRRIERTYAEGES